MRPLAHAVLSTDQRPRTAIGPASATPGAASWIGAVCTPSPLLSAPDPADGALPTSEPGFVSSGKEHSRSCAATPRRSHRDLQARQYSKASRSRKHASGLVVHEYWFHPFIAADRAGPPTTPIGDESTHLRWRNPEQSKYAIALSPFSRVVIHGHAP